MVELAVIDDNTIFLQEFKELLGGLELLKDTNCRIHLFSNFEDYLAFLRSKKQDSAHIAFIDMYMPEGGGVSLASVLLEEFPRIKTIFISAYPVSAMDIFEADPVYFLVKPIPEHKLAAALKKAVSLIARERTETVTFSVKGEVRTIYLRDILYAETVSRHLIIHTLQGDFTIRDSMRSCTEKLNENFVLCHRGYLVNMIHIKAITGLEVHLDTGEIIAISKRKLKETKDSYFGYITEKPLRD